MSTGHKRLSASKWTRVKNCPGSIRMEALYPDQPSGKAAIEGTHDHTLLETCIKMGLKNPLDFATGHYTMTDHEGSFVVDIERAERVKVAVDYVKSRQAVNVYPEMQVSHETVFGRSDTGGTSDIIMIGDDWLEIADYKGGFSPVFAENNDQMIQYFWGVIDWCIKKGLNHTLFKSVRLTIIQPRVMGQIDYWDTTIEHLMTTRDEIISAAEATDDPNAPLIGGDHCKWCPHKGACNASTTALLERSGIVFTEISVAQQAADQNPAELSNEKIAEIVTSAPLIRSLLEAVEAEANKRLNAGTAIPGLKLVNGKGSRKWAYDDSEMEARLKKLGIPKDTLFTSKLITPAQIEKVQWTKRDGTTVRLTPKQLLQVENEYIVKFGGKPTVVPESDPRPAIEQPKFEPVLPDWLRG